MLPVQGKELPTPPLPLHERGLRTDVRADPSKKLQRRTSWSEEQVNRLHADNRELRKAILEHELLQPPKNSRRRLRSHQPILSISRPIIILDAGKIVPTRSERS